MKTHFPPVSVVITAYNEGKHLKSCLETILGQTYPNFEVIVIDDGSQDKTAKIASEFKVKLLKQNHSGMGHGRNLGAEKSKGKILVFLDADMIFDRNFLKNLVGPIIHGKILGTFSKEEYVANQENIWSRSWNLNADLPINKRHPEDYPDEDTTFRAILKTKFLSVGGFDVSAGNTSDLTLAEKLGQKARAAPGAVCYHFNPDSLSEVFYAARWIGRGQAFPRTLNNLLSYSFLNSLRFSIKKVLGGVDPRFVIFKLIFDFGMFWGILAKGKLYK